MRLSDADLAREIRKVEDVLDKVEQHLSFKDKMNAALHMSDSVRDTPLCSAVKNAKAILYDLRAEAEGHMQPRYTGVGNE